MYLPILAGAALALGLFSGAPALADKPSSLPHSGFIKETSRLIEKESRRGELYLNYTSVTANARQTKRLYLKPLARFPADARFEQVDQATVNDSLAYLEQTLRTLLAPRVTLAANAEQADTALEVVLTDIASIEEGRKLRDLVPLRLLTNPIKNAAMGKTMQASGTLEWRISDPVSGEIWGESLQRGLGKVIGRADDAKAKVDFAALKPLLDAWTVRLSEEALWSRP